VLDSQARPNGSLAWTLPRRQPPQEHRRKNIGWGITSYSRQGHNAGPVPTTRNQMPTPARAGHVSRRPGLSAGTIRSALSATAFAIILLGFSSPNKRSVSRLTSHDAIAVRASTARADSLDIPQISRRALNGPVLFAVVHDELGHHCGRPLELCSSLEEAGGWLMLNLVVVFHRGGIQQLIQDAVRRRPRATGVAASAASRGRRTIRWTMLSSCAESALRARATRAGAIARRVAVASMSMVLTSRRQSRAAYTSETTRGGSAC